MFLITQGFLSKRIITSGYFPLLTSSFIVTQGFLSEFVITQGYGAPQGLIVTPKSLLSILRLTDQYIIDRATRLIIKDELIFTELYKSKSALKRIWRDQFVFQDPFITKRLDNIYVTTTPLIVFHDNGTAVPFIILTSTFSAITLVNPNFGDSEALINEVIINKTVGGARYSYIKTSARRKIEYTFNIRYSKMLELQLFLDNNNLEWILLTNWKNEIFYAKVTNNPVIFKGISRGWYSVELQFDVYSVQKGFYLCKGE